MMSGTYTPRSSHGTIDTLVKLAERIFDAERAQVALADDVVAHRAERVLGGDVGLARGHLDDAGHLGHDRPARQPVAELVDRSCVASRVSCRRTQQRAKLSPSGWVHTFQSTSLWARPTSASRRRSQSMPEARRLAPDHAVRQGHLGRDHADAAGAGLEDLVAEEQRLDLVAEVADADHDGLGVGDPALGQVVLEAADAVEVGVEPTAGDRLDLVEDVLAVAEGEERRRDRPELDPEVAEEQHDVGHAGHLEQDRADVTGRGAAPRSPSAARPPG